MEHSSSVPGLEGLAVEAVEWLPSGSDAGLIRVRGRWTEPGRREPELPALGLRRGDDARRFESLPDARFGRDPTVWRATYLVPAALMDPAPDALWLSWESGAQAGLPAPARGFEPPATPASPPVPDPGGEVIDRAVLAERRARRAEAAERTQAQRAAEALKAVEVLELRSAELERRLEALQSQVPAREAPATAEAAAAADPSAGAKTGPAGTARPDAPIGSEPAPAEPSAPAVGDPGAADALTEAVSAVKRLRNELGEQRQRLRKSELLRAADAVALASFRDAAGRTRRLQEELAARGDELREALAAADARAAEAAAAREQAAEQVAHAAERSAADAAEVRRRAADELAAARAEARAELDAAARDQALEQDAHARTRERLAVREQELAAIAAELAGVRAELATVRQDGAERAAELESRLIELETALQAERRAHGIAAAERETARAALALAESARSAEAVARTALDDELDRERLVRATLTEALDAARAQLAAAGTTESELVRGREQAQADAAAARAELEAIREEAASAEASVRPELAAAREQAASAEASVRAELAAAREQAASTKAELAAARDQCASAEASARELRAALDAARTELAAARARIAELEAELEAGRGALDSAGREAGGLMARIAELERAADDDLERRAREQAQAAAAVEKPPGEAQRDVAASLDAAAAALRARPAAPAATESAGVASAGAEQDVTPRQAIDATDEAIDHGPAEPAAAGAEPAPEAPAPADAATLAAARAAATEPPRVSADASSSAAPAAEATAPPTDSTPAPEPVGPIISTPPPAAPLARPRRPRIVTESRHPARADIVGSSKRRYPWLRGALVKLAHDDPRAATRLVLGLVPVQRALVEPPLEYDLTIRGSGTYAISIGRQGASVRSVGGPRPRPEAAFHVAADIVTLTELLAGVEKRMGRWLGSVRLHGRRRAAEALRVALTRADLDLAAAARAGADLDPDLVFRAFAYAIHPAWTKGHTFTVAQEIAGPRPIRWHVVVRDGAPVSVQRRSPGGPPDAVVSMTPAAYSHVLRGERAPSGERPTIRGDREAVALLKAWTDRAQGRAG